MSGSPSYLWDGGAWVADGERASAFRLGGGVESVGHNATAGTLAGGSVSGVYAFQVTAPRDMTIGHVALYAQSTGIQTINCPIYLDAGGVPASSRVAETNLRITSSAGWYAGSYNGPVQVEAGDTFWVGMSLRAAVVAPLLTSGVATQAYRWDGSQWVDDGMQIPAIRVLCDDSAFVHTGNGCVGSTGAMPYLAAGAFRTGTGAQIRVEDALPHAPTGCFSMSRERRATGHYAPHPRSSADRADHGAATGRSTASSQEARDRSWANRKQLGIH